MKFTGVAFRAEGPGVRGRPRGTCFPEQPANLSLSFVAGRAENLQGAAAGAVYRTPSGGPGPQASSFRERDIHDNTGRAASRPRACCCHGACRVVVTFSSSDIHEPDAPFCHAILRAGPRSTNTCTCTHAMKVRWAPGLLDSDVPSERTRRLIWPGTQPCSMASRLGVPL